MNLKTIEELWDIYKIARAAEHIVEACLSHNYSTKLRIDMINEIANLQASNVKGDNNKVHFINSLTMYMASLNPIGLPEVIVLKSLEAMINFYKLEKIQNWEGLTTREKVEQVIKDIKIDLEEIE